MLLVRKWWASEQSSDTLWACDSSVFLLFVDCRVDNVCSGLVPSFIAHGCHTAAFLTADCGDCHQ